MIKKWIDSIIRFVSTPLRKSIKRKMIVMIAVFMIIPLAVISILSFVRSENSMESEIINSNGREIAWVGKYADNTIAQLKDVLFTFEADQNLYTNLQKSDDSDIRIRYEAQNYIYNKMYSILYSNNNYNGLLFLNEDKKQLFYVTDEGSSVTPDYNTNNQTWYDISKKSFGGIFISGSKFLPDNLDLNKNQKIKSFYVLRSLRKFENSNFIGSVVLGVKWSVMDDQLNLLKTEDKSEIFITDINGNIIYNPYGSTAQATKLEEISRLVKGDGSKNSYIKTKDSYVFYYKIANDTACVMKIIPNNVIGKSARSTLNINIIIMIFSLTASILTAMVIASKITKPIIKLSKSMKGVKDYQLVSFTPEERADEIGVLEQSYSYMIEKIKYLIENEYKIKLEKRTAQLMALQAQINPHFLNNTLQLIGGIAISKDVPEIYTIIKAISNMFLYSIKLKDELVTIEQELMHIKDYLLIQQMRFSDRVEIEYNIDKSLYQYALPKLVIQPIVENAFKHGFEKKTGLWKLSITALKVENNINIIVEDNGAGIGEERLKEIKAMLDENLNNVLEIGGSMGVKNVDARIKLYFGNEYGLRINSVESEGTSVVMEFSALLKGEIK